MYGSNSWTTAEPKTNIYAEIIDIPPDMLEKAMENAVRSADFIVSNKGCD